VTDHELERPPTALGESDARPSTVVVHNPVKSGAFQKFYEVDDNHIETELLFRSRPNPALYSEHHDLLVKAIADHIGCVVYLTELLEPGLFEEILAKNPNQVFTRDSLITLPWVPDGFFCARLKPIQRQIESDVMKIAAKKLGLREIFSLPDRVFLEGGDVIPFAYDGRRCLLVGYGPRSTRDAIDYLQSAILPEYADEIIAIRLAPWRMNLDGGFVPVADNVVVSDTQSLVEAELISSASRAKIDVFEMLRALRINVIDTNADESVYCQSCNCLCLGQRQIICYDLSPRVAALISQYDIRLHRIPGVELIKGRGGPRCMSRPIYLKQSLKEH